MRMEWKTLPRKAIFLRRYKRFFADVELDGKVEVAHVANTGSLKSVLEPGRACLVLPADNPERKLRWTLVALESPDGGWIGIDTSVPNRLVSHVFSARLNPEWAEFDGLEPEKKIDAQTRLDGLLLRQGKPARYFEIKNVTLREGSDASFPDAVTSRGLKHLEVLSALMKQGHEAELIFTIQRQDCRVFRPAAEIDALYAEALGRVSREGLKISAWVVKVDERGTHFTGKKLPVELGAEAGH